MRDKKGDISQLTRQKMQFLPQLKKSLRCQALGVSVVMASLCFLANCGPKKIHISTANRSHPSLAGKNIQELTDLFNRKARRGNLLLSATLWDRAFIEAFLKNRATKQSWSNEQLQKALDSWSNRFVAKKTSFRLRLEALHRPLTIEGKDPVVNLESWRWELWDSSGKQVQAQHIKTETKKVFEGSKGRQSFRIDGNIHFAYTINPSNTKWIQLLAFPPGNEKAISIKRWYLKP